MCVALLAPTVVACGGGSNTPSSDEPGGDEEAEFLSHLPANQSGGGTTGDGDVVLAPEAGDGDAGADDGGAERAIAEADIIQVDGNRLYALSQFSGLSIINIADPTNLRLVGNYRSSAQPFEMYLEDGVAYVMYNSWYSYTFDEELGYWNWQPTSRVIALDVSTPSDLRVVGDLEVPGQIADSRKVGDIIYLATHQSYGCWGCDDAANSRVTSFDVSDPAEFEQVDSVVFQTEDGWQRSISVTGERIYVSGFGWTEDGSGTIDVVDIADPTGQMTKGASIKVAGQIQSRWQMDEFEGTLRVISQPGGWGTTTPPVVETFEVSSSEEIAPLAALEMTLPRPESLQSVRFDGDRAYAITFEQTDPLFTFNLANPANPIQVGELEIPGWVYHMEPRGDRIYALGFEDGNQEGALHVSLFDVSDMANPTMLDRVNFGGDWGGFAEDQDRIHKAFNIIEEESLIMVPFAGGGYDELSCTYDYQSGIQLVDIGDDALMKRGVAPQVGSARRALLHDGSLLGIGDNAVQAFDISDRDSPVKLDQLDTARNISTIKMLGNAMLRFGEDWWTGQTMLDVTALDAADLAEPLGELDLSELGARLDSYCSNEDGSYTYEYAYFGGQVFVHGGHAYIPRYITQNTESEKEYTYTTTLRIYIVDISDRTDPVIVGTLNVDPVDEQNGEYFSGLVQTDGALLVGRAKGYYYNDSESNESDAPKFSYDVIDLSDASEPKVVERFEVPSLAASGGFGYGVSGCSLDLGWGWWGGNYRSSSALTSGDLVASQHSEDVDDGTGRVRYYLDRIDVSDPAHPALLPKVNIPGSLVHFDAAEGRIVTIDYVLTETEGNDWEDCYVDGAYGQFVEEENVCRFYRRRLNVLELNADHAVLKDSRMLDGETYASSIAISNDRIFYSVYEYAEQVDPDTYTPPTLSVTALAYDSEGSIETLGTVELEDSNSWYGELVARDGRAFMAGDNELTVIDATGSTIELKRHEMAGWGCSALEVQNDTAYCAMGPYGVKSFALDSGSSE